MQSRVVQYSSSFSRRSWNERPFGLACSRFQVLNFAARSFSSRWRLQQFPRLQLAVNLMLDHVEHHVRQFPCGARREQFIVSRSSRSANILRAAPNASGEITRKPGFRHFPHIKRRSASRKISRPRTHPTFAASRTSIERWQPASELYSPKRKICQRQLRLPGALHGLRCRAAAAENSRRKLPCPAAPSRVISLKSASATLEA